MLAHTTAFNKQPLQISWGKRVTQHTNLISLHFTRGKYAMQGMWPHFRINLCLMWHWKCVHAGQIMFACTPVIQDAKINLSYTLSIFGDSCLMMGNASLTWCEEVCCDYGIVSCLVLRGPGEAEWVAKVVFILRPSAVMHTMASCTLSCHSAISIPAYKSSLSEYKRNQEIAISHSYAL